MRRMVVAIACCGAVLSTAVAQPATREPCFTASSSRPQEVITACTEYLGKQVPKGGYERALNRRGLAFHRSQRNKEALADFNALVTSNPISAGYLDNRRSVYQALGQFENALADANGVVHLAPRRAFGYHNRAALLFEMGRNDEAYRDYTTAFELPEPTPFLFSLYDRGRVLAKTRKFEQAVADFTSVFKGDPTFLYALRERAMSLIELGRMQEAERDLTTFLEREPGEPEAIAALGRLRATSARAPTATGPRENAPTKHTRSHGTAFFVAAGGKLLTNAHVVNGCAIVEVRQPERAGTLTARLMALDVANDLALLQVDGGAGSTLPKFRRQLRLGEEVAVFGYPLSGVVASSGNFTRGSVTALAGLRDDTTHFQLMAPVQPGNSGGPVLDQSGAVVGVVVGKLDALLVARATGSIPEQINFAIKASTALSFLEANGIYPAEATKGDVPLSFPDVADIAKSFTAHVRCSPK